MGSYSRVLSLVTFKSSKKAVASVSAKGVVTAKKAGKVKITIPIKSLTKGTTDKITYKVISGKKYIKADAYGQITVKKFKNKQQAVVLVCPSF